MAKVKTGIGATKRDLLRKIGKLKKFVDTKKGEFSAKDKVVFKKALISMGVAYKLLDKIPCEQTEMSLPFGYDYESPRRGSRTARRAR
jgi:hypothetical protein